MNSVNTTLGAWYELVESEVHKEERLKLGGQRVSIRYILSRYAQDTRGQSELFDTVQGLRFLISVYHTLGNFIPVPAGCNAPRGTGILEDYWDLTLKVIYEYYVCGEDKIRDIVKGANSELYELYKKWLDSFQDNNGPSWQCFIEKTICRILSIRMWMAVMGSPKNYGGGTSQGQFYRIASNR